MSFYSKFLLSAYRFPFFQAAVQSSLCRKEQTSAQPLLSLYRYNISHTKTQISIHLDSFMHCFNLKPANNLYYRHRKSITLTIYSGYQKKTDTKRFPSRTILKKYLNMLIFCNEKNRQFWKEINIFELNLIKLKHLDP